jgi:hypothetical protein
MYKENLKLLIKAMKSGKFDFSSGFSPILRKLLPNTKCDCIRQHIGPLCKVFKNIDHYGIVQVQGMSLVKLKEHTNRISILEKELSTY